MDSVAAELAGMQKDLAEVNAEIQRVRERLADDGFVTKAKPALVAEQRALLAQLRARRDRIAENLVHFEEHRQGGLSSPQAGTWTQLVLHSQGPVEHEVDDGSCAPDGGHSSASD